MIIQHIPKYQTPYGTFEFFPCSDKPGYSHRMVMNGNATKIWIPDSTKLNKKTVAFFVRIWCAQRDNLPTYHYADQNIDPPESNP